MTQPSEHTLSPSSTLQSSPTNSLQSSPDSLTSPLHLPVKIDHTLMNQVSAAVGLVPSTSPTLTSTSRTVKVAPDDAILPPKDEIPTHLTDARAQFASEPTQTASAILPVVKQENIDMTHTTSTPPNSGTSMIATPPPSNLTTATSPTSLQQPAASLQADASMSDHPMGVQPEISQPAQQLSQSQPTQQGPIDHVPSVTTSGPASTVDSDDDSDDDDDDGKPSSSATGDPQSGMMNSSGFLGPAAKTKSGLTGKKGIKSYSCHQCQRHIHIRITEDNGWHGLLLIIIDIFSNVCVSHFHFCLFLGKTTKDPGMLLFCTTKAEKGKRKRKCRKKVSLRKKKRFRVNTQTH